MSSNQSEMGTKTDKALFDRLGARDAEALNELIRSYSPELLLFIQRMVQSREDAQDILQDTFVRVWEKSHQFKGQSSAKTWIYRIAMNLAYSHLRKQSRWHHTLLDEIRGLRSEDDPEADNELSFQQALLNKGLETLTPRQRAVVIARVYEDLPFNDVAAAVGCSVNSAKVHFHEGKKRLEAFINERTGANG